MQKRRNTIKSLEEQNGVDRKNKAKKERPGNACRKKCRHTLLRAVLANDAGHRPAEEAEEEETKKKKGSKKQSQNGAQHSRNGEEKDKEHVEEHPDKEHVEVHPPR